MTNFDDLLRARLERLENAMPAPRMPTMAAAGVLGTHRSRRGRRLVVLLAAAAFLAVASVATAQRVLYPDIPEPRLDGALAELFAGNDCMTEAGALGPVQQTLDELGYADWTIESRPGAAEARCVVPGLWTSTHVVMLFPAPGRDVLDALEGVADELLRNCYGRTEAIALVSSVFTGLGVVDFSVHADPWGPHMAPIDQWDAYQQHVADGCFVYAGIQNGRDVDLWGPWP